MVVYAALLGAAKLGWLSLKVSAHEHRLFVHLRLESQLTAILEPRRYDAK